MIDGWWWCAVFITHITFPAYLLLRALLVIVIYLILGAYAFLRAALLDMALVALRYSTAVLIYHCHCGDARSVLILVVVHLGRCRSVLIYSPYRCGARARATTCAAEIRPQFAAIRSLLLPGAFDCATLFNAATSAHSPPFIPVDSLPLNSRFAIRLDDVIHHMFALFVLYCCSLHHNHYRLFVPRHSYAYYLMIRLMDDSDIPLLLLFYDCCSHYIALARAP